jgi:ABC-type multidrug transport system permease subunit
MLILRRRLVRHLLGMTVSPLLYMVAFGAAMDGVARFDGHSYSEFLLPGLVAMTTMMQSFGTATEINIARFYLHVFEEFQAAPLHDAAYVVGEILSGITRAFLGVLVILAIGAAFGIVLHAGFCFWLAVAMEAFVFAALAVLLAMVVTSHGDQALLTTFVITPMAFLGGTFFPVDRLPAWAQDVLFIVPLTHASHAIRADAFGQAPSWRDFVLMAAVGGVLFLLALRSVRKARD